MTASACDLTLTSLPVIGTPSLRDSIAQYRADFGFAVQQYVPGVLGVLRLDSLRLHLLHCRPEGFRPGGRRVAVDDLFGLHARLPGRARGALSGPPVLKPWGVWEFSLCDAHGNLLHLVQWAVRSTFHAAVLPAVAPRPRGAR